MGNPQANFAPEGLRNGTVALLLGAVAGIVRALLARGIVRRADGVRHRPSALA